jgi:hypothetical protein
LPGRTILSDAWRRIVAADEALEAIRKKPWRGRDDSFIE